MAAHAIVRPLVALICLAGTALGLNNTYGDNSEVRALAEQTACGKQQCSVKTLHEARSAFEQTFGFQTALVEKGKPGRGASVDVACQRALYLLGQYQCAVVSGKLPDAH